VNSGFYFQKYNERTQFLMEKMIKSISEIAVTHSHQATLTRHITEAHHLVGLQIQVLSQEAFPSGIVFHHDKKYIAKLKAHEVAPGGVPYVLDHLARRKGALLLVPNMLFHTLTHCVGCR
jgi:hypothetical protein